jgi:hypothetical protein
VGSAVPRQIVGNKQNQPSFSGFCHNNLGFPSFQELVQRDREIPGKLAFAVVHLRALLRRKHCKAAEAPVHIVDHAGGALLRAIGQEFFRWNSS